jgi:hypothetical protein
MCNNCNGRDPVGLFEEWRYDSCHIEYLESPGKDCERLRMYRLRRTLLDDSAAEMTAGAFIRKKQPDRPGAHDEDIGINCTL